MYSTCTLNNGIVAVTKIFTAYVLEQDHQPQPRQPVGFG